MIDPLSVVFVPGGIAAALVLFVGPLLALRQRQWRRQARARNARFRCARCDAALAIDALHLFQGAHICHDCATTLRSRFLIAVPTVLFIALGFGLRSTAPWVELEPGEVQRWDLFRRRLTTVGE